MTDNQPGRLRLAGYRVLMNASQTLSPQTRDRTAGQIHRSMINRARNRWAKRLAGLACRILGANPEQVDL